MRFACRRTPDRPPRGSASGRPAACWGSPPGRCVGGRTTDASRSSPPRAAIGALLPVARAHRPALARLGASPERMARAYRSRGAASPAGRPWISGLPEAVRDAFRARGRELVTLLLDHLDAPDPDHAAESLRAASELAAADGRESAAQGASLR